MKTFIDWKELNESLELKKEFKGLFDRNEKDGIVNYVRNIVEDENQKLKDIIANVSIPSIDSKGFRIYRYTDSPITVENDKLFITFQIDIDYTEDKSDYAYHKPEVLKAEKDFLSKLQYKFKIRNENTISNPGASYIRIKKDLVIEIDSIFANIVTLYNHNNRGKNLKKFGV